VVATLLGVERVFAAATIEVVTCVITVFVVVPVSYIVGTLVAVETIKPNMPSTVSAVRVVLPSHWTPDTLP